LSQAGILNSTSRRKGKTYKRSEKKSSDFRLNLTPEKSRIVTRAKKIAMGEVWYQVSVKVRISPHYEREGAL